MTTPCEKAGIIEEQSRILLMQTSSIKRIEEHLADSRKSQEKQTEILIDMARTQEKYVSLAEKTEINRNSLHDLDGKVDKGFTEVFGRLRKVETTVCTSSGKKIDGERTQDGKWDKGQITLWTSAVAGFFGFMYQLMTYVFDKVVK